MRILSLKGENLASLKKVDINFEDPFFTKTGVFAITGDTGAGKSTMLDAILLAIYGKVPRYDSSQSDDKSKISSLPAPDNGENIVTHDPNVKVSFAQVELLDSFQNHLLCQWRAEKNRNGKLKCTRLVKNLTTQQEYSLVRDIDKFISQHLKLSYDQFTRSVILPQGQFTRFIDSSGKERSSLLTTITGLDLYAKIVKKLGDLKSEYKKEQEKWNDDIAELKNTIKSDEELGDITDQINKLDSKISQCTDIQQKLKTLQGNIKACAEQDQLCTDATENIKKCQQEIENLKDLSFEVNNYQKVFQHREIYTNLINTKNDADSNAATISSTETLMDEKSKAFNEAEAELSSIQAQISTKESEKTKIEVLAQQAQVLDAQITPLQQRVKELNKKFEAAKSENQNDKALLAATINKIRQLEQQIEASAKFIDEHSKLQAIAAGKDVIAQSLNDYFAVKDKMQKNNNELKNLNKEWDRLDQLQKEAKQKSDSADLKIKNFSEQFNSKCQDIVMQYQLPSFANLAGSIEDLYSEILDKIGKFKDQCNENLNDAQSTISATSEGIGQIETLKETLENVHNLDKSIAEADDKRQTLERDLSGLTEQDRQLESELILKEKALQNARLLFDLSEKRKQLIDNQPCPLCGSVHHDLDYISRQESYSINEFQQDYDKAKKLSEDSKAYIQSKTNEITVLETNLLKDRQLCSNNYDQCRASFEKLKKLPLICQYDVKLDEESLNSLQLQLKAVLQAKQQQIASLTTTKTDIAQYITEINNLHKSVNDSQKTFLDEKSNAINYENNIKIVEGRQESLKKAINENKTELASKEDALRKIWPDWDPDAVNNEIFQKQIVPEINEYNNQLSLKNQNTELLNTANSNLPILTNQESQSSQRLNSAEKECEANNQSLQGLQNQRSQILGGKDPEFAKKICAEELEGLRASEKKLTDEKDAINNSLNALRGTMASLNDSKQSLEIKLSVAKSAYDAILQELELSNDDFVRLYQRSASDVQKDQERLHQAKDNLTKAQTNHEAQLGMYKQREDQLRIEVKQLPGDAVLPKTDERPPFAINQQYAANLQEELDICQNRRSELDHQVKSNDDILNKLKSKENEYLQWQSKDKYLKNLAENFGVKEGNSKFNNYVQSFIFRNLILQANTYIKQYNDRFELLVPDENIDDLPLVVVDHYSGDSLSYVRQLSGGEKFMISLSLAVALSDLSSSNAGKLQNLFIDEGFGNLDVNNFQKVVNFLEAFQNDGRLIGVITHVKGVEDYIYNQINVEKKPGSMYSTVSYKSSSEADMV